MRSQPRSCTVCTNWSADIVQLRPCQKHAFRSAAIKISGLLAAARRRTKFGERTFSDGEPSAWNALPASVGTGSKVNDFDGVGSDHGSVCLTRFSSFHALYWCFLGENTPPWNLWDSVYSIFTSCDLYYLKF